MSAATIARRGAAWLAGLLLAAACGQKPSGDAAMATPSDSAAPAAAAASDSGAWRPLVDSTLSQWRGYRAQAVPAGWRVENGVLMKDGVIGDLLSREQYGDFELQMEWRLSAGGNAGLFYRASEQYDHPYWSGPEYQLLDDAGHPDGKNRKTAAGAAYGLYEAPAGVVRPAGEWNQARLVVRGNHVEHYLNGQRTASYDFGSPEWTALVKASKFNDYPAYGRATRGHLAIQGDHEGVLAIRDLRLRELGAPAAGARP